VDLGLKSKVALVTGGVTERLEPKMSAEHRAQRGKPYPIERLLGPAEVLRRSSFSAPR
jgi:hypothetical protein